MAQKLNVARSRLAPCGVPLVGWFPMWVILAGLASGTSQAATAPLRILWLGNSLTYTYDIPGQVTNLAGSLGVRMSATTYAPGGWWLEDHSTDATSLGYLDSGNFDLVMLQEQSQVPSLPYYREYSMKPAAQILDAHARAHGARSVLYNHWGFVNGDSANFPYYDIPAQFWDNSSNWGYFTSMNCATRTAYVSVGALISSAVSPVGLAWQQVRADRPDLTLYLDDRHPSATGSYLAACVHYAAIFGRSPEGSTYLGNLTDSSVTAYLQQVAGATVLTNPWAVDAWGFGANNFYWAYSWDNYQNPTGYNNGVYITGAGPAPSPSVKLDSAATAVSTVYLGVYDAYAGMAGQGRLFVRNGGALTVQGDMVVGQSGTGWVRQDGGSLTVGGTLTLGQQASGAGHYALNGGSLATTRIVAGSGAVDFSFTGGQLSFQQFGGSMRPMSLSQAGGTLSITNTSGPATIYGNYIQSSGATLSVQLGAATNALNMTLGRLLGGNLVVSLAPGFVLRPGSQFPLLSAASLTGTFPNVSLPPTGPDGLTLSVSYTPTAALATVVLDSTDSDGNGLPDWWEQQWFGSPSSGQGWLDDPDHDGVPNGLEYAFGTNPLASDRAEALPRVRLTNGYIELVYRERAGGTGTRAVDYSVGNLRYTVQVCDDLSAGGWCSGTNLVEWTGWSESLSNNLERIAVRLKQPVAQSGRRFLRLSVSSP
jgi:hypothetical protein